MQLTVVVAGNSGTPASVAELWRDRALLGIFHEENGKLVLRLESHARAVAVDAAELERALALARQTLGRGSTARPVLPHLANGQRQLEAT
jgi:hypothetical protein